MLKDISSQCQPPRVPVPRQQRLKHLINLEDLKAFKCKAGVAMDPDIYAMSQSLQRIRRTVDHAQQLLDAGVADVGQNMPLCTYNTWH